MKIITICKGHPTLEEEVPCYEDRDLERKRAAIERARDLWRILCSQYTGPQGSCVLGAGIQVRYLGPRCRKYSYKEIISPSVTDWLRQIKPAAWMMRRGERNNETRT